MKTIGLLGGMSWESTETYYRLINEGVKERLGGFHSAKICLYSVDFEDVERLQHAGDWDGTARILVHASKRIEAGGADFLLICTNTMHKVAPQIEAEIGIPILHIADAAAEQIKAQDFTTVGLLGTNFTMEQEFYKGRLLDKHNIEVVIPESDDRLIVHDVIYQELCQGKILSDSRNEFLRIIDQLAVRGAQAVILGCTEIPLLIQQEHTSVPLFNTTEIHARQAVEKALAGK
ncbi:aspartate racemase [candidate division KSB3 bacterium]|uniref:Aspartate racemase n=1 Tax=candidate division KSB3 bacterium TaxID=2044937 RepID=A0A2G6KAD0_9BACT|nr:MAG: aspartate racemase [candidate division KSB3 bacterium]